MNLESLFCPPEGAMQFEVTIGWRGEPVPEQMKPLILWVSPAVPAGWKSKKPDCPHAQNYPVVHDPRPQFRNNWRHGERVCECVGRIIE